ncbi:MAG: GNAT family N-acetyltransferase [Halobacteriota archaeon]
MKVECEFLGSRRLSLSHDEFAYAGKFRLPTSKAVARDQEGEIAAALCYDEDRCSDGVRIRYVTVRDDLRGEGVGPELAEFAADNLLEEYPRVRVSVNNAYAYVALHRAGFGYTGERGPQDELVLQRPPPENDRFQEGLDALLAIEPGDEERRYIRERIDDVSRDTE